MAIQPFLSRFVSCIPFEARNISLLTERMSKFVDSLRESFSSEEQYAPLFSRLA
jgi:hypothetical protein